MKVKVAVGVEVFPVVVPEVSPSITFLVPAWR